jgi:hypothetical protein
MVAKERWPWYLVITVILGVLIIVGVRWLRSPAFSLVYGIKPLASVSGRQIYLKRAAGLFYDRMALSLDDNRCAGPDESTDYMFRALEPGISRCTTS